MLLPKDTMTDCYVSVGNRNMPRTCLEAVLFQPPLPSYTRSPSLLYAQDGQMTTKCRWKVIRSRHVLYRIARFCTLMQSRYITVHANAERDGCTGSSFLAYRRILYTHFRTHTPGLKEKDPLPLPLPSQTSAQRCISPCSNRQN